MRRSRGFRIAAIVMIVIGLVPIVDGGWIAGLPPLAFGVLFGTGWFAIPFSWWMLRKRPDLFENEYELRADERGVAFAYPTSQGAYAWSTFRRTYLAGGYYLLDSGAGVVVPVPETAFARLLLDAGFSPDGAPIDRPGR
jgi:hypothetical protein